MHAIHSPLYEHSMHKATNFTFFVPKKIIVNERLSL